MYKKWTNKIGKADSYLGCPKHAHHTVTVRSRLHLYFYNSIRVTLMSIYRTHSMDKKPNYCPQHLYLIIIEMPMSIYKYCCNMLKRTTCYKNVLKKWQIFSTSCCGNIQVINDHLLHTNLFMAPSCFISSIRSKA